MKTPYTHALGEIGTFEWAEGSNPQVLKYFKGAGSNVSDDDVPWCAAFVGWCCAQAGIEGTGKLNAQSYLDWGTPVDLKEAREGDVVIIKRGRLAWQGHVFFYISQKNNVIRGLGGNQSDAVNVRNHRVDKGKLLGVRRPPVPVRAASKTSLRSIIAALSALIAAIIVKLNGAF